MLGMSLNLKNSVISHGVAGTPGNSGNSGRSSTWTGSGSLSGPQLGANSSGNNILSSGSTKKKSKKIPLRLARVIRVLIASWVALQISLSFLQEQFKLKRVQLKIN